MPAQSPVLSLGLSGILPANSCLVGLYILLSPCWSPRHIAHCPSLPPFCLHPFFFLFLASFMYQPPSFLLHSAPFSLPGFFLTTLCCPCPTMPHVQTSVFIYPLSPPASSVPLYPTPLCSGSSGTLSLSSPAHGNSCSSFCPGSTWLSGHHLLLLLSLQIYEYRNGHQEVESPFQGRLQWNGSKDLQDVSITVLNVTLNDSGLYTCNVSREFEFEAHRPFVKTTRLIPLRVTEEGKTKAWSLFKGWARGQWLSEHVILRELIS